MLYADVARLPELPRYQRVGPDFWPRLCLLAVGALALGGLVRAARRRGAKAAGPPLLGLAPNQLLAAIVLSIAYAFAMDTTGFLLATLVFQVALLLLLGIRRPTRISAASAVNLFLLYGIFIWALGMPLPRGAGFFRALSLWFY